MYKNYEEICSICLLLLMCISLLPIIYLGTYNHPTGDDYPYGAETLQVLRETGSVIAVLQDIWSADAYCFVTAGILLLFTAAVFYFLRPVTCNLLKGSNALWMSVSAVLVPFAIQIVPFRGEFFSGIMAPCIIPDISRSP